MTESEEREVREGFERWVDERIHSALSNLPHPFESRIKKLKKRVEKLKDRFQNLSQKLDSTNPKTTGVRSRKNAGGGSRV